MSTALITGGSRGLGLALARELSRRGWKLVIDARGEPELEEAASSLGPGEVAAIPGDIADPDHRRELTEAVDRIGPLDLLVNNASVLGPSPLPGLDHYPIEDLERVLRINTIAPLALVQLLLPKVQLPRGRSSTSPPTRPSSPTRAGADMEPPRPPSTRSPPSSVQSRTTSVSTHSTPATCERRCTSRRFPARTSPTGPSRRRWCRR